jgi:hypothetical protein
MALKLSAEDVNFLGDLGTRTQVAMIAGEAIGRLSALDTFEAEEPTAANLDALEAELLFEAARLAAELGDLPRAKTALRAATRLYDQVLGNTPAE